LRLIALEILTLAWKVLKIMKTVKADNPK